ncbi:MAG: hypothetical protein H6704_26755 [Myxococcales bacterium]|nr:hypothetical protein [Myxococcales bacterium]
MDILLYAEDALLEALGARLATHVGHSLRTRQITHGRGGLESRLDRLNAAAAVMPVLALLDRDRRSACPGEEVQRLVTNRHPRLLLRLAVEEADAWLLADQGGLARFLGIPAGKVPPEPEALPDPKQTLLNLARKARSRERRSIAPAPGTSARVGPGYNQQLCAFVARGWSIDAAAHRAASLARCLRALRALG